MTIRTTRKPNCEEQERGESTPHLTVKHKEKAPVPDLTFLFRFCLELLLPPPFLASLLKQIGVPA